MQQQNPGGVMLLVGTGLVSAPPPDVTLNKESTTKAEEKLQE